MESPEAAKVPRARLVAHLAPGALAWTYIVWIALDGVCRWSFARLLEGLYPLQLAVAALGFLGGAWALWLPSRGLRVGVFLASLLGAMLLAFTQVVAERVSV